jgi:hypothetical protein
MVPDFASDKSLFPFRDWLADSFVMELEVISKLCFLAMYSDVKKMTRFLISYSTNYYTVYVPHNQAPIVTPAAVEPYLAAL